MREARKDFWVFIFWMIVAISIWVLGVGQVLADRYHHKPNITYLVPPPTVEEVVNVTEITEYSHIQNYTPDNCQGIAIAQAGANNTMYAGTKKPMLSLGVGECGGELASSLMFGMRVNNQLFLNGSWAADESVNGFGIGATVIFK